MNPRAALLSTFSDTFLDRDRLRLKAYAVLLSRE